MLDTARPILGLGAVAALQRPLFDGAPALDQQLAAVSQRCGGGSGGTGGGGGGEQPADRGAAAGGVGGARY